MLFQHLMTNTYLHLDGMAWQYFGSLKLRKFSKLLRMIISDFTSLVSLLIISWLQQVTIQVFYTSMIFPLESISIMCSLMDQQWCMTSPSQWTWSILLLEDQLHVSSTFRTESLKEIYLGIQITPAGLPGVTAVNIW